MWVSFGAKRNPCMHAVLAPDEQLEYSIRCCTTLLLAPSASSAPDTNHVRAVFLASLQVNRPAPPDYLPVATELLVARPPPLLHPRLTACASVLLLPPQTT